MPPDLPSGAWPDPASGIFSGLAETRGLQIADWRGAIVVSEWSRIADAQQEPLELVLTPAADLRGVLRDEAGKPIAGRCIRLSGAGVLAAGNSTFSDRLGRFRFAGLAGGQYQVITLKRDHPINSMSWTTLVVALASGESREVEVTSR